MGILVHLEKINKSYNDGKTERKVLINLDFKINENEFVAIKGKSGCGKTTLLSIIGMNCNPTDGVYTLEQNDISFLSVRQKNILRLKKIGFIYQTFNLIEDLSVEENVKLPLTGLGYKRKEIKERSHKVLKKLNMEEFRKSYPIKLSGGEQQRVAIARAIVTNPVLILADEPTGNLDQVNGKNVMDLLKELNLKEKTTICLVSHDDNWNKIAQRCLTLRDGQLIREG